MNHLVRLAAVLAVLLPSAARADLGAQPQTSALPDGVVLTPRLGVYAPSHGDMEGFKTGMGFEIAAGKRFTPYLAAEVGIGWFQSGTGTMMGYDATLGIYSGTADFSALPVTATAKLIAPMKNVDLYAVGGLGVVFTDVGATVHTAYGSASRSHGDTSLAVVLGAGGSMVLTPRLSLEVLARYLVGNADVNGQSARYDGLLFTGGLAFGF